MMHGKESQCKVLYGSSKLVVARSLLDEEEDANNNTQNRTLCYRTTNMVTAVSMSPSGYYVAHGDEKGTLKVWAYDTTEHLTKYEGPVTLTGPIRDIDWDGESKRIAIAGERSNSTGGSDPCCKALQWDTGVSTGNLALHLKGRASSIAYKQTRPYRIVTAGKDDGKIQFHSGPPFARIIPDTSTTSIPCETAHAKNSMITCVRYSPHPDVCWVCSVGSDRQITIYDGKTLEQRLVVPHAHNATIYACAWNPNNSEELLTASGDGTCKLWKFVSDDPIATLQEIHTWNVARAQSLTDFVKVPTGGMQMGCIFITSNSSSSTIPVSVSFNGQMAILGGRRDNHNDTNPITLITGHVAPIADMVIVDDNVKHPRFYTGDTDGILCQWDLRTCRPIQRLCPSENSDLLYHVHAGAISGVGVIVTSKATVLVLSVGWDDQLYVTNATKLTGSPVVNPTAKPLLAQPSAIATGTSVAVITTVRGLYVVSAQEDDDVVLGDFVSTAYEPQPAVAVSSDDSMANVGGKDCKIYVYKIGPADPDNSSTSKKTLTLVHVIENGHYKPIHALALSHDGTKLASSDERDVCVWDLTSASYAPLVARGKWCFHTQRVTTLSWSPDDRILASGGADDNIYLWCMDAKMKRIHYPFAHRGGVVKVVFVKGTGSGGGGGSYKFLSTGVDSVVNLWDVQADVKNKFG
jgi:WD40 repeat protein